jgi:hypothetical protein
VRKTVAGAAVAGTLLATAACGSHAGSTAKSTWGGYPAFLPRSSEQVHRVVVASDAKPAYAEQGDTVDVHLSTGSALVTVVGPATPGQGLYPQPPQAFCTFTVTVVGEKGTVPVRTRDFSTLDDTGRLYALTLTQDEAAPPATIGKGQRTTFQVRTLMPTGEGILHWEPGGTLSPVGWDFTVETD